MSKSKSQQNLSDRYASSASAKGKSKSTAAGTSSKNILLVSAIVVVALAVVVVIAVATKQKQTGGSGSYNLVVTPENIEELRAADHETVAADSYDVSMNSTWTFTNARSASSNAYIQNPLSNSNTVNFTVTRNDTGATIYTSPYIPVGSSLSNIKLEDEEMGKGTYPCVVTYHLLDGEYKEVSTVKINISVVIEND